MPYKNLDMRRQVARESMRRKRMLTPVNPVLTPIKPTLDELRQLIKGIELGGVKSNQGGVVSNPPPNIPTTKLDADGRIIPEYW